MKIKYKGLYSPYNETGVYNGFSVAVDLKNCTENSTAIFVITILQWHLHRD